MAVTIFATPAAEVSGYRPIIWDVQSDRFGNEIIVVAIVTSTGGFADYTVPSHPFVVGDIVTPEVGDATLNVRQTITFVDANSIITDKAFSGSSDGFITRTNDAFQIRGDVFAIIDEPVKSITKTESIGGSATFTVASHGYSPGDLVEITGTTSYNGTIEVLLIFGSDRFAIETAFVADETGSVQKYTVLGSKRVSAIQIGTDDIFRFNFQNSLRAAVSSDLAPTGANTIISPNVNSIRDYVTRFTEEFNDIEGLLQSKDEIFGDIKKVTNITLQHEEAQNLSVFLQDNSSKRFLTNVPDLYKLLRTGHLQLGFLTNLASVKFRLKQFDDTGAEISNVISGTSTITDKRGTLRIAISSMLALAVKFSVRILSASDLDRSEERTFVIDDNCFDNEVEIYFLNLLGAYDSFVFTGDRRESKRSRKTEFEKILPKTFTTQDRGITTLGVVSGKIFEIFGKFIDEETALWLEELESSPDVLQLKGTKYISLISIQFRGRSVDEPSIAMPRIRYELANTPIIQDN